MLSTQERQELEEEQKQQTSTNSDGESANPQPEEAPAAGPDISEGQKDLSRPSAEEIYKQVSTNARQELGRSTLALALSAYGGGVFMGLSALGTAIALFMLTAPGAPPTQRVEFISKMFYPLGFIVVILGRSQLFTENTLYPVALVLAERKHLWNTLRLWATVLPANVLGAFTFALLATLTAALSHGIVATLAQLGLQAAAHPASTIFWSGVMGGWIIATAAWLVSGSHSITGSVMVIWLLTFVVGLGNFAHCIAASGEVFAAILTHQAPWTVYFKWFLPAVAGNVTGGVMMVTILEYGQVIADTDSQPVQD